MALVANEITTPIISVLQLQQRMCDLVGHPDAIVWDRYGSHERSKLERKLRLILVSSDEPSEADVKGSSKLNFAIEKLVKVIWKQRKYCEGTLLMAPIFVACVNDAVFAKDGLMAVDYSVRPLFRIAKCFDKRRQTDKCCTIFVDETGRVYANWSDFTCNNIFGSSVVVVAPENGIYNQDRTANDMVKIEAIKDHHRLNVDTPATIVGVLATGVGVVAVCTTVAPLLVVGAAVAGISCSAYGIGRGIARLMDRSQHEQSIGLNNRESRSVWLGIGGSALSLGAGAAVKGVQLAAESGKVLGKTTLAAATSLGAVAMATNGAGVANGFYSLFQEGKNFSKMEALQLSASLFIFTHSMCNFQTAGTVYQAAQQNSLNSFMNELGKNQRRMFNKMLKETVRNNVETGRADVIRSLRTTDNRRGFFQNIYKINSKLNENKIKISFDRSARPVMNNEVPFDSAEVRANLRSYPAEQVFGDLLGNSTTRNSGGIPPVARNAGPSSSIPRKKYLDTDSSLSNRIILETNVDMQNSFIQMIGSMALKSAIAFVRRFFDNYEEFMRNRQIRFDDNFVYDILSIIRFLAKQAGQMFEEYVRRTAEICIYEQLARLYENRFAAPAANEIDDTLDDCMLVVDSCLNFIRCPEDFRARVKDLLVHELSPRILQRLLNLAQMNFWSLMEINLKPSFGELFDDLLEVLLELVRQSGLNDLSFYVSLMRDADITDLHERLYDLYRWMLVGAENAINCSSCAGCYAICKIPMA